MEALQTSYFTMSSTKWVYQNTVYQIDAPLVGFFKDTISIEGVITLPVTMR